LGITWAKGTRCRRQGWEIPKKENKRTIYGSGTRQFTRLSHANDNTETTTPAASSAKNAIISFASGNKRNVIDAEQETRAVEVTSNGCCGVLVLRSGIGGLTCYPEWYARTTIAVLCGRVSFTTI
jgi:hypothetical protein